MSEEDPPVSKAQTVRAFIAEHPDASATAVAEALAAKGVKVLPSLVAAVKASLELQGLPIPEPEMPPGHVPFSEGKLFYELYAALCSFVNRTLNVVEAGAIC